MQTMSTDLMAGVLRGKGDTTVVVVVDKVMDERENAKPRNVMIKLNPTMVSEVVLINDRGHRSAPMSPIKMVTNPIRVRDRDRVSPCRRSRWLATPTPTPNPNPNPSPCRRSRW